nr:G-type lectin S-receptor-like serine/threonine-protein kinase At4g27290 [Ipomoea batatas]
MLPGMKVGKNLATGHRSCLEPDLMKGHWKLMDSLNLLCSEVQQNLLLPAEQTDYKYELKDHSVPTRSVLTPFGVNPHLTWIEQSQNGQTDSCGHYALCGTFGKCNINNSPPCDCHKGFIPKYPQEWDDAADWLNGCTRRTQLDCGDGDRFLKFTWFNGSISLEEFDVLNDPFQNIGKYQGMRMTYWI